MMMRWRVISTSIALGLVCCVICGAALAYGQSTHDPVLVYVQEDSDQDSDIYLLDLNSNLDMPLVVRPGSDYFPTWSPSGDQVAFISSESGGTLSVVDSDGGNLRLLVSEDSDSDSENHRVMEPGWTGDGGKIVLIQENPPSAGARRYQFYLVDPETGEFDPTSDEDAAIQEHLGAFRLPDIPSPDGTYILRLASNNLGSGLFILDDERQSPRLIHSPAPYDIYRSGSFSWSWDNTYVAFTVDQSASGGSHAVTYVVNIHTGELQQIGSGYINYNPRWRP